MTRNLDEQIDFVRIKIGVEMSNLAFAEDKNMKAYCNEQLDYLYSLLDTLTKR